MLSDMNPTEKSLVSFYSEPNFLALSILENLLANNCYVNIVTEDVEIWKERTLNIAAKNKFSINAFKSFPKNTIAGYTIFCSGFINKKSLDKDLKNFWRTVNFNDKKTFIVVPKESFGTLEIKSPSPDSNIGIIYVGDLLGPRLDLDANLKMARYLQEILSERSLTVPVGEVLYPIFVSDASRQIVKWLFAFGPYGRETLILGSDTSPNYFWQINTKLIGEIKYLTNGLSADKLPRGPEIFRMSKDINFMLTETYKWIKAFPTKDVPPNKVAVPKVKDIKKPDIKRIKKNRPNLKYVWIALLVALLFPIIDGLIATGLSYTSYMQFKSGRDNVALSLLNLGKNISVPSYAESRFLKHTPFFGQIYKETEYISYSIISSSEIANDALPLVNTGRGLVSSVLGDKPYSIVNALGGSAERMQKIYKEISDFEKGSIEKKNEGSLLANIVLSKVNIGNYKQLISQLIVTIGKLPNTLGEGESKTYLILFENNMELRPTGGFIGSYGLLTFDGGRLSDFTISDVYSADGQLNGHVEPPAPIKQYLGEANWWLRDSNWDPDFPTSAKRAEWFLDKEMDKNVDGVIAVDLYPIEDFLKVSGPISLPDYGTQITSENFYEKVQSEVQDNFFPGTHKKASFLTALSKSILGQIGSLSSNQSRQALQLAYKNLNERHVQVFLHDGDLQRVMNNLGWDGAVFTPMCSGNCFSDLVGIVEANVGVNKSNYFIKRSAEVDIVITGNDINKVLTLTLQNSANPSLGLSGRYKPYIRVLVPQGATNVRVTESMGKNTQILTPEISDAKGRMEIGVITEILGSETKKIIFSWSNKGDKSFDEYDLYFRKQAGVENYPVSIIVSSKNNLLTSNPTFALTDKGNYLYNTTLVRDLFAKLSF